MEGGGGGVKRERRRKRKGREQKRELLRVQLCVCGGACVHSSGQNALYTASSAMVVMYVTKHDGELASIVVIMI